jgi:hypothetical protein
VSRKLLILNLALAAVVVYAGVQFRRQWVAAKAREAARLPVKVPVLPPPAFTPLPTQPPVLPSGYADIAKKMLFDRSRDSTVVIETPPPPPPKPMPPLPVYHGMMNIGADGPTAILSANNASPHQAVHPGEIIGPFKLVEVDPEGLTLEWEGKQIRKKIDELNARAAGPGAVEAAQDSRTAPAAVATAPPPAAKSGPGEDTGRGFRICAINDGVAEGGVADGYRKVVYSTPFGQSCRYEPVK